MRPLAALLAFAATGRATSQCRCLPSDPCWPSVSQWQCLNASLDGNLVAVRPVASVCHDPNYNAAACAVVTANQYESAWLATQPGALQWPNWGARPEDDQYCYVGTTESIPCGQGRISLFSAVVQSAEHIQAAVRFASKFNLRLAIKNTGHSFLGWSSAPESFQILTHFLNSTVFTDDFVPQGCKSGVGSAVTIGAGVVLTELYAALGEQNLIAVAGLSHTVGAAGGYIQGGGHSPLGTLLGMASDNALEFSVVTAEGDLVVANACQNSDLFWALRGGGGGTFGVVVNATIRTWPDIPGYVVDVEAVTPNVSAFYDMLESFHTHLPAINDFGGSGYYYMTLAGPESASAGIFINNLSTSIIFANITDPAAINATLDPLLTDLASAAGPDGFVGNTFTHFPASKYAFQQAIGGGSSDIDGFINRIGSRLVSHAFVSASSGPARLVAALRALWQFPIASGTIVGHMIAGGQVARNADIVDSALNPAWRRTLTHIVFGSDWTMNATLAQQEAVTTRITDVMVPILKTLEPDMGCYLNEADADESGFQYSFWGSNYAKLYAIKQKWDPNGLFITRRGVGSEDWNEDGMCKLA